MNSFERRLDLAWEYFSRAGVIACFASVVLLGFFLQSIGADPDLFARLAAGRLIHLFGHVAIEDPFAFTPTLSLWVDHEWLAGLAFYATLLHGGPAALFIGKCVLVSMSLYWLARAASERTATETIHPIVFLVTAFSCLYLWSSTVRSQVFTYLFLPYLLYAFCVTEKKEHWYALLLMPFIMPIWSNAHGGFVVGLGLMFVFMACLFFDRHSQRYPVLFVFLITLATSCITPYGPITYWEYILHAVTMERAAITEWDFLHPLSLSAVIPNLYVLIFYGWYRYPETRSKTAVLLTLVSLVYGYKHRRLIAIFLMVATVYGMPLILKLCREAFPKKALLRRSVMLCIPFLFILHAGVSLSAVWMNKSVINVDDYPEALTEWLWIEGKGGRLLVDFNRGSYALWRLYPKYLISMDGRYEEVYPNSTVRLVSDAMNPASDNFSEALSEISPDYILLATTTDSTTGAFVEQGFCMLGSTRDYSLLAHIDSGSCDSFSEEVYSEPLDSFTPHF